MVKRDILASASPTAILRRLAFVCGLLGRMVGDLVHSWLPCGSGGWQPVHVHVTHTLSHL
jgi:hypothetical protein